MYLIKNSVGEIALVKENNGSPWLNHLWSLPGEATKWEKKTNPPSHFKHSITHHSIFVKLTKGKPTDIRALKSVKWIDPKNLSKLGVSSVVLKALKHWEEK